jgi:hypothetical protein
MSKGKNSNEDHKIAHITVRIRFKNAGSLDDIAENCDYEFDHEDIIDTEILDCEEKLRQ